MEDGEQKKDYEKLDEILVFISNKERMNLNTTTSMLKNVLFNDLNEAQIKVLIHKIHDSKHGVCDVVTTTGGSIVITSNDLTKPFLKEGGFTKIQETENLIKTRLKEKNDIEFEKTKIDFELSKKMLKEFPKTKIRANVGLAIAIVLAIAQLIEWIIKIA